MKILVTGGAGFLGSYVVDALLARGDEVTVFQRSAAPALAAKGVRVAQGSLRDGGAVGAAVAGQEAVMHVAAKAGVWGKREDYEAINVLGTRHVLEACRTHGVRWLVHTSTPSVVFTGEAFNGADESLPYGRNWLCHYAETKARAEAEALSAHSSELATCALRPHLIWGVGDPHLLPRVIARARAGRLRIVGEGTNRVDVTHVRNAAAAHVQALEALREGRAGGKAYFLSQGEPVVLWDWVNTLLEEIGIDPVRKRVSLKAAYRVGAVAEWVWRTARLGGEPPMTRFVATELAKDHWFSIEAARRDLGYAPERHPTAKGVAEYVAELRRGGMPA
ncbi:MAG: NAD-dependent epimerase/dehydratase family protein [Opitutales bacterium]